MNNEQLSSPEQKYIPMVEIDIKKKLPQHSVAAAVNDKLNLNPTESD
jgi:hypothetical protein